ncbi:MAG: hypothetical protein KC618_03880 [Candidatus Omnitrophica bacterium]|nr:hypothetical protein [Candidatus Omnitrophota bacterium]
MKTKTKWAKVGFIFSFIAFVGLATTYQISAAITDTDTLTQEHPIAASQKEDKKKEKYVKGKVIVKLKNQEPGVYGAQSTSMDSFAQLNRHFKVQKAQRLFPNVKKSMQKASFSAASTHSQEDLSNVYLLDVPEETDIEQMAAIYQEDPNIEYAQPDYLMEVELDVNDFYLVT